MTFKLSLSILHKKLLDIIIHFYYDCDLLSNSVGELDVWLSWGLLLLAYKIMIQAFDSNVQSKREASFAFFSQNLTEEVSVCQKLDIIFYSVTHGAIMVRCHRQSLSLIKAFHPPLGLALGRKHFVL